MSRRRAGPAPDRASIATSCFALLSCKAYYLDDAMASFAPAVGSKTAILPLLNGMRHLDVLDARFGHEKVLGGQCVIATTVTAGGRIVHMNSLHSLSFGERPAGISERTRATASVLDEAGFESEEQRDHRARDVGEVDIHCRERGHHVPLSRGGRRHRCGRGRTARAAPRRRVQHDRDRGRARPAPRGDGAHARDLTAAGSTATATMLRDIEAGARIEAEQIIGDLLARAADRAAFPILGIVHTSLKA